MVKDLAVFLVRTELHKGAILVKPSRMSRRQIENVARADELFRTVTVPDMDASLEEIAPVRAMADIICQSYQQWSDICSSRKFSVGNRHFAKTGFGTKCGAGSLEPD